MGLITESILADKRRMEFYEVNPVHKAMLLAFNDFEKKYGDIGQLEFFVYSQCRESRDTKMFKAAA